MGLSGKQVIHPSPHPSLQGGLHALARRRSRRKIAILKAAIEADALLGGAIKFEGEMLDPPMFGKALQTLLRAHALHALSDADTDFAWRCCRSCPRRWSARTGRTESSCRRPRMALRARSRPGSGRSRSASTSASPAPTRTSARRAADRVAMIVEDDALGTSSITYARARRRAPAASPQLLRDLGIGAGRARADPAAQLDRLPDRVPRRDEARRDQRADLDAAHRRRRCEYLAQDSGARRSSSTRPPGRAMGPQLAGSRHRCASCCSPGEARSPRVPGVEALDLERRSRRSPPGSRAERPGPTIPPTSSTRRARRATPRACCTATARSLGAHAGRVQYWFDFAEHGDHGPGPRRGRPHRALGQVQLDLRAGLGAHGPALPRQDRDRARGQERRRRPGRGSSPSTAPPSSSACRRSTARSCRRRRSRRADVPTLRHCMSAGEHLSDEVLRAVEGAASASTSTRRSA